MADNQRQYFMRLRPANPRKELYFYSLRKLRDAALEYPSDKILYIGYKDGDGIKGIRALSVFSEGMREQVRTRDQALDDLLGTSINQLLNNPATK